MIYTSSSRLNAVVYRCQLCCHYNLDIHADVLLAIS